MSNKTVLQKQNEDLRKRYSKLKKSSQITTRLYYSLCAFTIVLSILTVSGVI